MSSREHLDMDRVENGRVAQRANPASEKIDFNVRKGCFLERGVIVFLCLVTVCAIVAVGLLVAYFGACSMDRNDRTNSSETDSQKTDHSRPYLMLPTSIVPLHYVIELQPFLVPSNFTIKGQVEITVKCVEKTSNVTLHVKNIDMDVSSLRLSSVGDEGVPVPKISRTSQDKDKQFFILHMENELQDGIDYKISAKFLARLSDNLSGFYRSSYKDKDGNVRYLPFSFFHSGPVLGR